MEKQTFLTFAELEKTIHEYQMEESRRIMKEVLKAADDYIFEHRDEQLYRLSHTGERIINTIFGRVTFTRRAYAIGSRSGDTEIIYLLDKMLSPETIGTFSLEVAKEIRRLRDEKLSYAQIRDKLRDIAGIIVTRAVVPNVLFGLEKYLENPEAQPDKK